MKKSAIFIVTAFLITLSAIQATAEEYGKPLSLTEVTAISDISNNPAQYIGKKVLVEGMVVEVCAKRGCWIDIASDAQFEKIQIKVADGEIVFPMSARGKKAKVEGIVESIEMSQAQALRWRRHKAEEKGLQFDPSTVTGPETIYRIKGQGAVIE